MILVAAQMKVSSYRVDFMCCVYVREADRHFVAVVECDGHDFHDRTKEQAARDKARDRHMAEVGLPVLRFTGSEIFKDANQCALQTIRFMQSRATDISLAAYISRGDDQADSLRQMLISSEDYPTRFNSVENMKA